MATKSIARKVTVATIILVTSVFLLALFINFFFFTYYAEKASRRALDERLVRVANSLLVPVISDDYGALTGIATSLAEEEDVAYLQITVPGGKEPLFQRRKDASGEILFGGRDLIFEDVVVARAEMGLIVKEHDQAVSMMLWYGLGAALIAAVTLALGLKEFIHAFLERPLQTLGDWTDKVALGQYSRELPPLMEEELKQVGEKFRWMAEKVKTREEMLIESERKFRDLAELLPQMVFEVDSKGRFLYVNMYSTRMFGYSREELLGGLTILDLVSPADRDNAGKAMAMRLQGGVPAENEFAMVTRSGRELTAMIFTAPVKDSSTVTGLRGILVDISEKKKLQEQLVHSQKMVAIELLASGIAHDFNNLLQMISGYSEYLLMNRSRDPEDRVGITRIRESAMVAASLVQRILAFGANRETSSTRIDLHAEIKRSAQILSHALPKAVEVKLDLDREIPNVAANGPDIDQVLLNLALNSRDAMPEGGVITISTGTATLDEDFCAAQGLLPGPHVLLTVSDTGLGMDKETLERIFEPFFTTKKIGKGTGLGLSTVRTVVKRHGGTIACESTPGKGTTFKIYLPALKSEEMIEGPAGAGRSSALPPPRILIVEQEKMVLDLAKSILERRGYEVFEAQNHQLGLELYSDPPAGESQNPFDLVILDMDLPDDGGKKFLLELERVDPGARVLIASSYPTEGKVPSHGSVDVLGVIQKPFRINALAEKVGSAIKTTP